MDELQYLQERHAELTNTLWQYYPLTKAAINDKDAMTDIYLLTEEIYQLENQIINRLINLEKKEK